MMKKEESGQGSDLEDAVVLAGESLDSLLLPVVEIFGCQSVVFLFQINPAPVLANTELFFLGQLLDFSVVLLVSDCGCRSQEEGTQDYCRDEWKAKEGERVFC